MEFFYASALRHYKDAQILRAQGRYDNAVHLYGFAAECALKSLIAVYCDIGTVKKKYGHSGSGIVRDLYMFVANGSGAGVLEPTLSLKLAKADLPEVLFKGHPERRYANDGIYKKGDADQCEAGAGFLVREMIAQHINGYI